MEYGICYVSSATDQFKEKYVEDFMYDISLENNANNIRGILLYSEGNFLQVLEGEKSKILKLYSKIEQDPRHKGIIQIVGRELRNGSYDGYETRITHQDKYQSVPKLLKQYMKPLVGMDSEVQNNIKSILKAFIRTRSFT